MQAPNWTIILYDIGQNYVQEYEISGNCLQRLFFYTNNQRKCQAKCINYWSE